MKKIVACLFLVFFAYQTNAQDTIRKIDGNIVIAKVLEITDTDVKYKRYDQPDGPLRSMRIVYITKITYSNGTEDNFRSVSEPVRREVIHRRGRDLVITNRDLILSNGMYIEGMMGYAFSRSQTYYYDYVYGPGYGTSSRDNVSIGFRLGTKWYFGESEKHRMGIQANWIRINLLVPENQNVLAMFAPVNVGFTNIFKLGEKSGLEANLNFGLAFTSQENIGGLYGVDVKFRYERLTVGLDLSRMDDFYSSGDFFVNSAHLSIGAKF